VTDDDDYSALEALDEYVPAPEDGVEQELSSPLYTVTNPAGTVSVTVCLDGRVDHVELAPKGGLGDAINDRLRRAAAR